MATAYLDDEDVEVQVTRPDHQRPVAASSDLDDSTGCRLLSMLIEGLFEAGTLRLVELACGSPPRPSEQLTC